MLTNKIVSMRIFTEEYQDVRFPSEKKSGILNVSMKS